MFPEKSLFRNQPSGKSVFPDAEIVGFT